jgi:hypothetical protein
LQEAAVRDLLQEMTGLLPRQKLSRVNRLAIAPDLEMQSRLAFRPLTHGRNSLAGFYFLSFFDQQ